MPRTWGYIFVAIAALIGAGALLLPVPETIEVAKVEEVEKPRTRPQPTPARTRPQRAAKPPAAKPPPKPMPRQDTTKSRQTIQPKPKS